MNRLLSKVGNGPFKYAIFKAYEKQFFLSSVNKFQLIINRSLTGDKENEDTFGVGSKFSGLDSRNSQRNLDSTKPNKNIQESVKKSQINDDADTFGTITNEFDSLFV